MENREELNKFQIHQGSYLNARLNKLLEDIDKFSLSPLKINKEYKTLNARLLARTMSSVASTIYGEVNKSEKEKLKFCIRHLECKEFQKIFLNDTDLNYDLHNGLNFKVWVDLRDFLLNFRLYLSELLEKYGLGISFEKSQKQEMWE